jgi:hypothetical protein
MFENLSFFETRMKTAAKIIGKIMMVAIGDQLSPKTWMKKTVAQLNSRTMPINQKTLSSSLLLSIFNLESESDKISGSLFFLCTFYENRKGRKVDLLRATEFRVAGDNSFETF